MRGGQAAGRVDASVHQRQEMINNIGESLSLKLDTPVNSNASLDRDGNALAKFFFERPDGRREELLTMVQEAPGRYKITQTESLGSRMRTCPDGGFRLPNLLVEAASAARIDARFSIVELQCVPHRHTHGPAAALA